MKFKLCIKKYNHIIHIIKYKWLGNFYFERIEPILFVHVIFIEFYY